MALFARASLMVAIAAALTLGWGYWYALGHADLKILVYDHGLGTERRAYGSPHNVSIVFRDQALHLLAEARSVEPQGYILALHPDVSIGNCQSLSSPYDYSNCYKRYSAWSATWAEHVHLADVTVGPCSLRGIPVAVRESNDEWLLWWVPLPHIGGLPRRYFTLSMTIDTGSCSSVDS